MDSIVRLDNGVQKGNWDEGHDPRNAFDEIVAQGYDPEAEYCVGSTTEGLFFEVYRGNLLDSLVEAAKRSGDGYFVVMPAASSLNNRVKVH